MTALDGRVAPNQPPRFENRARALHYRLVATAKNPSGLRQEALTTVLHRQKAEAYRNALLREGRKYGIHDARGPLDPFTEAQIWSKAQTAATQIMSTYQQRYHRAADRGDDLDAWSQRWWNNRAPMVLQYEYGLSDNAGVRDFYHRNLAALEEAGHELAAHVEPRDAAAPDICQRLIDRGYLPVDEAMGYIFPAHQNCPHYVVVSPRPRGMTLGTANDLSDGSPLESFASSIGPTRLDLGDLTDEASPPETIPLPPSAPELLDHWFDHLRAQAPQSERAGSLQGSILHDVPAQDAPNPAVVPLWMSGMTPLSEKSENPYVLDLSQLQDS